MSEKAPVMVFSGTNSRYLAEKICASLDCPLGKMNITHFADGEFAVSYEESIRAGTFGTTHIRRSDYKIFQFQGFNIGEEHCRSI